MRNLRKYLAIAIVMTMIMSFMAPIVHADEYYSYEAEAQALYDLGLYKGVDTTGKFVPDLGSSLDRQTATVMLLRMFGEEEEAMELGYDEAREILEGKFSDAADVAEWAVRQVAYGVDNEYIKGYPKAEGETKAKFGPTNLLTGREYCTLSLKMLKYDGFEFEDAGDEFAEAAGLEDMDEINEFGVNGSIKKDVLVGISHRALLAKYSGEDVRLAEKLVEKKIVSMEKLEEVANDVYEEIKVVEPTAEPTEVPTAQPTAEPTAEPVVYSVTEVTATNGSVNVVFDNAFEADPTAADFSVTQAVYTDTEANAEKATVEPTAVAYDSATKTVTLTVAQIATSTTTKNVFYEVAYKEAVAVKSTGFAVEASGLNVMELNVINTTTTNDINGTVESGATFDVVFDRNLDETTVNSTNFALKTGSTVVACDVDLQADKKTVRVKPVTPMTIGAEYTLTIVKNVKVDGTEDTLNADIVNSFTVADALSLASIKVGGRVVDKYTISTGNIVLTFNKDLSNNTVNTETIKLYNKTDNEFVALASGNMGLTSSKVVTIVPPATYLTDRMYQLQINGLKSLDGLLIEGFVKEYGVATKVNRAPTITDRPQTAAGADATAERYNGTSSTTIAYTVAGVSAPSDYVVGMPMKAQAQFGRDMDASTLTSDNFYFAKVDELGKEIVGTKVAGVVTYDAASFTATLMPTAPLEESQSYAAIITEDVKDAAGVPSEEQLTQFETDDFTSPTVTSTSVDSGARVEYDDEIVIHFSEKMDAAHMALVAAAAGEAAFTATTSIRLYNQTDNLTLDGLAGTYAGLALQTTYAADETDPRLVIKAPTNGWGLNKTYEIVMNGNKLGETTMSLCDYIDAPDKTHGNMLADDVTVIFTTVDESKPNVTAVKTIKTTDGASATVANTELSRTEMTYNIQNAGTAATNHKFKITFNKKMATGDANGKLTTSNLEDGDFQLWVDVDDNGTFATAEKHGIIAVNYVAPAPAVDDGVDEREITVDTDEKTLIWTPNAANLARLQAEHECRLVIKYTVTDLSSQDLGENTSDDISYRFTTGAGPAYDDPDNVTASVYPVKFAEDFVKSDHIEVKFNESIDYKTISNVEIRKGAVDGDLVAGTWYVHPTTETLPTTDIATFFYHQDADLEAATKYYVVVPETVKDPRGNKATPYNYYFTVKDTKVPVPTITMPTEYDGAIIVTYDTDMTTGAGNATDPSHALAYTVEVNGFERTPSVSYDEDDDIATLRLDAEHIPQNNQILKVTVKAGITAANDQVTAAAVSSPEVQMSNADNVASYGIESAVWNASNKELIITLDRPADAIIEAVVCADLDGLTFTGGRVGAANFVGMVYDDGVITVLLQDLDEPNKLSIGTTTKVLLTAGEFRYNDAVGAATNFESSYKDITYNNN